MEIEVWVCPTEGCGNYFGASSQAGRDLNAIPNHESSMRHNRDSRPATSPVVVSYRGDCPDCSARGNPGVRRVRLAFSPTDEWLACVADGTSSHDSVQARAMVA